MSETVRHDSTSHRAATADGACADPSRRDALKAVARYGAYVAPAMLVLMSASAQAANGNGADNGNAFGLDNSTGNSPSCENPGRHLGYNHNHHSAC